MKFNELDGVKTLRDFEDKGIKKGEIGTIITSFSKPDEAYEVEFCDETEKPKAIFPILPKDLELFNPQLKPAYNDLGYASGK